jgi:voltage-gated potassium channel Kch
MLPRNPGARLLVGVLAFFVVLNVVSLVASSISPEPSGKDGSAYATQPRGAAAYAELLRRGGHPIAYLRDPLQDTRLDPGGTVIVLDADLEDEERATLARFVRDGGRLVAAGEGAGAGLVPRAPRWTEEGPTIARPSVPVPETSGVRQVRGAGDGSFSSLRGALPVLGGDRATLAVARAGRGRALLLADSSPLQNRLLAEADNAALGLGLAGAPGRRVTFVESVHGFGRETGFAALPARWQVGLSIGVLAALLLLLSRARRLGPAEPTAGEPTPARREHVDALALALARAREPDVALAPVRALARAQIARSAALADGADSDEAIRAAALKLGFEEDEVAALVGDGGKRPPTGDVQALGRALARGRR